MVCWLCAGPACRHGAAPAKSQGWRGRQAGSVGSFEPWMQDAVEDLQSMNAWSGKVITANARNVAPRMRHRLACQEAAKSTPAELRHTRSRSSRLRARRCRRRSRFAASWSPEAVLVELLVCLPPLACGPPPPLLPAARCAPRCCSAAATCQAAESSLCCRSRRRSMLGWAAGRAKQGLPPPAPPQLGPACRDGCAACGRLGVQDECCAMGLGGLGVAVGRIAGQMWLCMEAGSAVATSLLLITH